MSSPWAGHPLRVETMPYSCLAQLPVGLSENMVSGPPWPPPERQAGGFGAHPPLCPRAALPTSGQQCLGWGESRPTWPHLSLSARVTLTSWLDPRSRMAGQPRRQQSVGGSLRSACEPPKGNFLLIPN